MSDKHLTAFAQEVTATLLAGKRHQISGFGTFSSCARKATADRAACKIAMFRASNDLRAYISGGPPPNLSSPHTAAIKMIIESMLSKQEIEVPMLGRMAIIPVSGK